MKEESKNNDLQEIITQALNDLKIEQGDKFDITKVNLAELGYSGSKSALKNYIQQHKYLLPPKRLIVSPQGNRGRRYGSEPGESYHLADGLSAKT